MFWNVIVNVPLLCSYNLVVIALRIAFTIWPLIEQEAWDASFVLGDTAFCDQFFISNCWKKVAKKTITYDGNTFQSVMKFERMTLKNANMV